MGGRGGGEVDECRKAEERMVVTTMPQRNNNHSKCHGA